MKAVAPSPEAKVYELVQLYVKRSCTEEVDRAEELGGMDFIYSTLESSARGLTTPEVVRAHQERFGPNTLPKKETSPLWLLLWVASSDPMLRVLMVAAIVLALVFGQNKKVEWIEGFAIFVAVMIVICVTAGNDYVKEKRFAELYDHEERWVQVIRMDEKVKILKNDVVAGDVVFLEAGDELPADAMLISGHNIKVDEAALTGESDHIAKCPLQQCIDQRNKTFGATKDDRSDYMTRPSQERAGKICDPYLHHKVNSPLMLSGSTITSGSGNALIIATGRKSQMGQLFSKLVVDNEPTPLQNKLNAMASDVGKAGFIAAIVTLAVLIIEYAVQIPKEHPPVSRVIATLVEYVVTAITIIVVAVPEGLPLAVTISLAFSVGRMLKDQNYVRRLAACETMGGASEICSDKTGTLTKNQMEVETYWNGSRLYGMTTPAALPPLVDQSRISFEDNADHYVSVDIPWPKGESLIALLHNIAINSTGFLAKKEMPIGNHESRIVFQQVGSPTDCALISFGNCHSIFDVGWLRGVFNGISKADDNRLMVNCGVSEELCPNYKGPAMPYVKYRIPFSSEKKYSTVVCIHPSDSSLYRIYTKGAAEIILNWCSRRIDSEGKFKTLNAEKIVKIEGSIIQRFASVALRTICLAYRDAPCEVVDSEWAASAGANVPSLESDFVCLGIVGIRDPLREEVNRAIMDCKIAGVRVRMCTGDNIETARQIALKAGIYQPELGGLAMSGSDFLKLTGGVVCKHCQTETCKCESKADHEAVDVVPQDSEDLIAEPREEASQRCIPQPKPAKKTSKTVREDVLKFPDEFAKIADRLEVMARSQPSDKYALVTGLRNMGRVVAVTGDGTNDAPALKKADVGFAMGITGKETAKQAADIVLMDDNFASIVKAIKWGRNVYDNIQRFLQFQLTVNLTAVMTAFVGACILRASPLTAVQLLWVNLIMDAFAALALATELPTDKLLNRPPHSRKEYLVSKAMWRNIITQVIYQVTVMGFVIFRGECWLPEYVFEYPTRQYDDFTIFSTCGHNHVRSGRAFHPFTTKRDYREEWTNNITPSRHFTYVFNIFVMMQAFNLVSSRKIDKHELNILSGLFRNPYWISIMSIILIGQILIVQYGGRALNVHKDGLTWQQWLICVGFGVGTWIAALIGKLVPGRIVEHWLPETNNKELNPLTEPAGLALASRGRISSGRISSRMNIRANGMPIQQQTTNGPSGRLGTAFLQLPQ